MTTQAALLVLGIHTAQRIPRYAGTNNHALHHQYKKHQLGIEEIVWSFITNAILIFISIVSLLRLKDIITFCSEPLQKPHRQFKLVWCACVQLECQTAMAYSFAWFYKSYNILPCSLQTFWECVLFCLPFINKVSFISAIISFVTSTQQVSQFFSAQESFRIWVDFNSYPYSLAPKERRREVQT